jgi:peptidyl-prolyl cis-trans isomerase C
MIALMPPRRLAAAAARGLSARNATTVPCRLLHSTAPSALGALGDAWGFLRGLTLRAEASHILVKGTDEGSERRISAIREEIGGDPDRFAEVAARNSDCPSGQRGGSLGEFGRFSMVPEFDRVIFREEVGVVHGPIETSFGYHLILIQRRTGTTTR